MFRIIKQLKKIKNCLKNLLFIQEAYAKILSLTECEFVVDKTKFGLQEFLTLINLRQGQ